MLFRSVSQSRYGLLDEKIDWLKEVLSAHPAGAQVIGKVVGIDDDQVYQHGGACGVVYWDRRELDPAVKIEVGGKYDISSNGRVKAEKSNEQGRGVGR